MKTTQRPTAPFGSFGSKKAAHIVAKDDLGLDKSQYTVVPASRTIKHRQLPGSNVKGFGIKLVG